MAYAPSHLCSSSGAVEVGGPEGYLSSVVTKETRCGSTENPWWVKVQPGQTITFSILDFGDIAQTDVCQVVAVIKEELETDPAVSRTVCAGKMREGHLYTSQGNMVEVRILQREDQGGGVSREDEDRQFLLHYKGNGRISIRRLMK